MGTLWQDIRYGFRQLLRNPGFTAVAALTLALGIGANTAIFSVVNGVLLRPLAYPEPDRLAIVWQEAPSTGFSSFGISEGQYEAFRDQLTTFQSVMAYHTLQVTLDGADAPERIAIAHASVSTLATLGLKPVLGRDFLPEEGQVGRNQVVLLSHGLWQRRYGGDPDVIGRAVKLDGADLTIVGVLPAPARLPRDLFTSEKVQLWMPEIFNPQNPNRWGSHYLSCLGRLKPDVKPEQAQAEVLTLIRQIHQAHPESDQKDPRHAVHVEPLREYAVSDVRRALLILMGAVGFVLLIACVNVANLLLARATSRQKEMAVRAALGAGRPRLVAQLLTESGILAVAGGGVGILLAVWGVDILSTSLPTDLPRLEEVQIDLTVLLFTVFISMLTAVIFGVVPALHGSRLDLGRSLHEESRSSTGGRGRRRALRWLVSSEVALAVVLVFGAALLAQSLYRLLSVDAGFRRENLLIAQVSLPSAKYTEDQLALNFYSEVLSRLRALPQVESAAMVNVPPLGGFGGDTMFDVEGRPLRPQAASEGFTYHLGFRVVSPGYFETLGVRLMRGRTIAEADGSGAQPVTVINETMAARFWPEEDPIGRRIRLYFNPTETGPWMEIVGIVADTKIRSLTEEAKQEIFIPQAQLPLRSSTIVIRTSGDVAPMTVAVRDQVRAVDPALPLFNARTMNDVLNSTIAQPRMNLALLGAFAGLALVMAMVGVYGVLAYRVTERTHEFGVRLALGAQPRDILWLLLREGMAMVGIGLAAGLLGALALTQVLAALLYKVEATDPLTIIGVSLFLAALALVASYFPARRATRVDPMTALRYE